MASLRPLLVYRWLSPLFVLTWFALCVFCVQISPSYEDTSHIGLVPTLMALFKPIYFFKDTISKYSHVLRSWGLGLVQHMNFGKANSARDRHFGDSLHLRHGSCPEISPHLHPGHFLCSLLFPEPHSFCCYSLPPLLVEYILL